MLTLTYESPALAGPKRKWVVMESILIVYWSGTGNTELMAQHIAAGIEDAGLNADVFSVDEADASLVEAYSKYAFGCPSMGVETLEEDEFEPFFKAVEPLLDGKKVALFGSYDWGDGEWMTDWVDRTQSCGASVMGEGLMANLEPEEAECVEYGRQFAAF